ncbi:hypothetical protein PIB30_042286 [Stylosanthes scabra]|uniref:Uncharacterized protein n=1 Tax=Stylosanthes scabra TaxID=79078 RepID=A0ABU6VGA6_9FABA|nr:hypothetical protein [Stylosanthes scabra]
MERGRQELRVAANRASIGALEQKLSRPEIDVSGGRIDSEPVLQPILHQLSHSLMREREKTAVRIHSPIHNTAPSFSLAGRRPLVAGCRHPSLPAVVAPCSIPNVIADIDTNCWRYSSNPRSVQLGRSRGACEANDSAYGNSGPSGVVSDVGSLFPHGTKANVAAYGKIINDRGRLIGPPEKYERWLSSASTGPVGNGYYNRPDAGGD